MPFSQPPSWRVSLRGQGQQCIRPDSPPKVTRLSQTVISGSIINFHVHNRYAHTPASLVLFPVTSFETWRIEAPLKFKVQPPLLWGEYLCCAWRGWGLNTPLNEKDSISQIYCRQFMTGWPNKFCLAKPGVWQVCHIAETATAAGAEANRHIGQDHGWQWISDYKGKHES